MHAHGSDMFACVRLLSIFGSWISGGVGLNVKERVLGRLKVRHDAVQSEWVPLASGSCCGLDIILVCWPGLSHRPGVLVLPLFIQLNKAESNLRQFWLNWAIVAPRVAKLFSTFAVMTMLSLKAVFRFSLLNQITLCILLHISSWSQALYRSVKSELLLRLQIQVDKLMLLNYVCYKKSLIP